MKVVGFEVYSELKMRGSIPNKQIACRSISRFYQFWPAVKYRSCYCLELYIARYELITLKKI